MTKIVNALLTGQRKIMFQGVEVCLNPLKKKSFKEKEQEATAQAREILKALAS